jgi:F-type H+-transporting ATPase subunit gamma
MASLQDIRRRIRSVKNTQQVTKAMKMISAVKLRKSQERLLSMRPFVTALHKVVAQVTGGFEPGEKFADNPLAQAFFSPREEKKIHLVAIAGDKGLCGGFNTNVLKAVEAFLHKHPGKIVKFDAIGKRTAEWAKKTGLHTSFEAISLSQDDFTKVAHDIGERAIQSYADGEIDALYLIYNRFNSAVSLTPSEMRVFPPDKRPEAKGVEHLLEPDPETVLCALLPYYVETEIYRAMLESSTSEHAARMVAMDKATGNASEMIDKLTLHMNKVRQAAITNQIIEVVSGAAVS